MILLESSYDIIYLDERGQESLTLGECSLPDDRGKWGFWQIANIGQVPSVLGVLRGKNPHGKITFNTQLPGYNFDGRPFIKMGLKYGTSHPIPEPDWCRRCDTKGMFVRTALVCPDCNDLLGGF